ncbi:hypothetical protein WICPIJ_003043 [Wickerhamomyces pijperi]|uniref:Uncharacterized protein n=1 Tax=Wickerhamomyces pijperi TaxID=599730 RepID=A0A9P8Q8M4_WICPI|nr:hypothetical protein WICPIJ_003043 [Wickerhamomyces pijperi]
MAPTMMIPITKPAGPPLCKEEPEPTNKPVPIPVAMEIIIICLFLIPLFNFSPSVLAWMISAFSSAERSLEVKSSFLWKEALNCCHLVPELALFLLKSAGTSRTVVLFSPLFVFLMSANSGSYLLILGWSE